ncbi:MAG: hypothetical protein GQ570_03065 [Helicobacteraceae bacterium]|nr:hypothetical protein [Helicobacteraceae bacterium]
MEISTQTNSYEQMSMYQQKVTAQEALVEVGLPPSTMPIKEETPEKEIPIEEQMRLDAEAATKKEQEDADVQASKDAQREYAAGYASHQSKQSQVEIYLSVATGSDIDLGNDTANILETLRDVQKQNNQVTAYSTYQENQNSLIDFSS